MAYGFNDDKSMYDLSTIGAANNLTPAVIDLKGYTAASGNAYVIPCDGYININANDGACVANIKGARYGSMTIKCVDYQAQAVYVRKGMKFWTAAGCTGDYGAKFYGLK